MKVITLSPETKEKLGTLQISENPGGYQNLVRLLRVKVDVSGANKITLQDEIIERLQKYSKYGGGNGGYQTLFKMILQDAGITE